MSFRLLKHLPPLAILAGVAALGALTACAGASNVPAANVPAPISLATSATNAPTASASTAIALATSTMVANNPAPAVTIALSEGRFTPLGRVRVSDNPTASDYAILQTAEAGKLGLPVFVEFYADNWGICKSIEATVRGLQTKYDGKVKFVRINIDEKDSQAILKKYNVRGTPTIVLLDKAGRAASNAPGWVSEQAADDALKALAALP